ncbi:hypothetical protein COLU111180_06375 [Cohnella lubricantis]|uniref:Uncharacterized protein n=1 Tax=Cohnella lubricantis TaxID=2163172 RepID=A0A841TBU1_9BACL|nr:hypothetical protein [Cohnella lubricantis]MBB6677495.1 hypothetical protein [Cohnella lubricantis]MBP2116619.1 hypothetical protein [Cohnella lubricantis]
MGEARRRKLAGNTAPDKQWHADKAARKHTKKVMREMNAVANLDPLTTAAGLMLK